MVVGISTGCKDKPAANKWAIEYIGNIRLAKAQEELTAQGIEEITIMDDGKAVENPISTILAQMKAQEEELIDDITPIESKYLAYLKENCTSQDYKVRENTITRFVQHMRDKGINQWTQLNDSLLHTYLDGLTNIKKNTKGDALSIFTKKRVASVLKHFMTWLTENKLIEPVTRKDRRGNAFKTSILDYAKYKPTRTQLKKHAQSISYLTPTQITDIDKALAETNERDRLFFNLLVHSGVRQNEGLNLLWASVDFDNATIHIRPNDENEKEGIQKSTVKTDNSIRSIPIDSVLLAMLKTAYADPNHNHYVISFLRKDRERYDYTTESEKAIKSVRPDYYHHLCRHTYISSSLGAGNNPFSVAAVAGDNMQTILETYGHFYKEKYNVNF